MKIKLEIRQKRDGKPISYPITRIYEIDEKKVSIAKDKSKLIFLNEYINKTTFVCNYINVTDAMKNVNLQINAYQIF